MCNQQSHVNFDKVDDIMTNDINTEEVLIIDTWFEKAKLTKLNNWKTNNIYEEMPYNNQKLMNVKWVCTVRETNNQQYQKTHLSLKDLGNQQKMKY